MYFNYLYFKYFPTLSSTFHSTEYRSFLRRESYLVRVELCLQLDDVKYIPRVPNYDSALT